MPKQADDPTPRRVPEISNANAISVDGACLLLATGEMACLSRARFAFDRIAGLTNVASLATGLSGCFVDRGGQVGCVDDSTRKVRRIAGVNDATSVTSGLAVTCAVRAGGQVVCARTTSAVPRFTPLGGIGPVRQFVLAGSWGRQVLGCAQLENRALRCFALENVYLDAKPLELVDHDDNGPMNVPATSLASFEGATTLAVSVDGYGRILLAANVAGKVATWTPNDPVVVLPDLDDASQLVHGCALRAQGSVVCWGSNAGGVLGQPSTLGQKLPPTTVVGIADVVDIATSNHEAWALTRDGRVFHWGRGGATHAAPVAGVANVPRTASIAASLDGALCMLGRDGSVWCWLDGESRYLERVRASGVRALSGESSNTILMTMTDGTVERRSLGGTGLESGPIKLPQDAIEVAGVGGLCFRSRTGRVDCDEKHPSPVGVADATTVVVGGWFACALRRGGNVTCWRTDLFDQVPPFRFELHGVPDLDDAVTVTAAADRACALRAGGRVSCWAITKGVSSAPVDVIAKGAIRVVLGPSGERDAADAASVLDGGDPGGAYGCAIMTDRRVQCWGTNSDGQIGDGSIRVWPTPIGVGL